MLEVGAHLGHCTRVLSRLFGTVLALENSLQVLKNNAARNEDLRNVVYMKFHSVMDDWALFSQTPIHAVFIDAAHDYGSVRSDLERALALPHVRTIVLDDYGTTAGVHRAIDEAVASGLVKIRSFIGRAPPWSYDGSRISDWEGVVRLGRHYCGILNVLTHLTKPRPTLSIGVYITMLLSYRTTEIMQP